MVNAVQVASNGNQNREATSGDSETGNRMAGDLSASGANRVLWNNVGIVVEVMVKHPESVWPAGRIEPHLDPATTAPQASKSCADSMSLKSVVSAPPSGVTGVRRRSSS